MISKRQKEVLDFIKSYIKNNKYSPSLEEIKNNFGLASVSTAYHHVTALENAGCLIRQANQPRALELNNNTGTVPIQLRGLIAAGAPIEAVEKYQILQVPKSLARTPEDYFALEVRGNSMIEEGVFDGDYVVIKKQEHIKDGDTVVAIINGNEATLKKIYKIKGGFRLQPANPELKPFTVKEIIVQGKVVSVMRNYEARKKINSQLNFITFSADLKDLVTNTQEVVEKQFQENSEYNLWRASEDTPTISKFCIETVYCFLNEIILLWVARDKKLIDFETISNVQQFLSNKHKIKVLYSHIFENDLFDWFSPTELIFLKITNLFNKYDFSEIDRDLLGRIYEKFISIEERKALGQFYTPDSVIDYILDQTGYKGKEIIDKKIIDISCGSGGFLSRAVSRLVDILKNKGLKSEKIINKVTSCIFGLDINPFARYLAETNILIQLLDLIIEAKKDNPRFEVQRISIFLTNTVEPTTLLTREHSAIAEIKDCRGQFKSGFDYVVGNPPYLEAKKMDKQTKVFCKIRCPEISNGAFDLFICFIDIGLRLLSEKGKLGYIIPNKFLIANYSKSLRKRLLDKYSIKEIVDVSECEVFENTSVYPIILVVENTAPTQKTLVNTAENINSTIHLLAHNFIKNELPQKLYDRDDFVFFLLPSDQVKRDLLLKLLDIKDTIANYLDLKWTISFHASGLRDQFLFDKQPGSSFDKKIIGGKSFAGNSDIERYKLDWGGWWIKYDESYAKSQHNPLPPKSIFEREKLIICQNALRLRATIDSGGYFCKDTFFVASLNNNSKNNFDLKFFLAILNSKLMHYYYANIYKGTHVAGGYLHYLISYLDSLPITKPTKKQQSDIVVLVDKILRTKKEKEFVNIDNQIDELIYGLYDLNNTEIEIVKSFI